MKFVLKVIGVLFLMALSYLWGFLDGASFQPKIKLYEANSGTPN